MDLSQLKDIFVKEDPHALNEKMNDLQVTKQQVLQTMITIGNQLSKSRQKIHAHLRDNFQRALDSTKKSAGMEVFELWAGADMPDGIAYSDYVYAKDKMKWLDKIRESLDTDLSVLQSRAKIFQEIK